MASHDNVTFHNFHQRYVFYISIARSLARTTFAPIVLKLRRGAVCIYRSELDHRVIGPACATLSQHQRSQCTQQNLHHHDANKQQRSLCPRRDDDPILSLQWLSSGHSYSVEGAAYNRLATAVSMTLANSAWVDDCWWHGGTKAIQVTYVNMVENALAWWNEIVFFPRLSCLLVSSPCFNTACPCKCQGNFPKPGKMMPIMFPNLILMMIWVGTACEKSCWISFLFQFFFTGKLE
jgi:hypothetical protein